MLYSISDCHGCYSELCDALQGVDLGKSSNKLVLCGDYVDRGTDSLLVLEKVMQLQDEHPGQVIALRGNHDDNLITWVTARDEDVVLGKWTWRHSDQGLLTTKSLLRPQDWAEVEKLMASGDETAAYQLAASSVAEYRHDVLSWIASLPYYHETESQIYVHAGVLEFCNYNECPDQWRPFLEGDDFEMDVYWRTGTTPDDFTGMRLQNYGHRFYKDVIGGHTPTSAIVNQEGFCGIVTDGAGHYYIDGGVFSSGVIPVLAYDEIAKTYSGPGL